MKMNCAWGKWKGINWVKLENNKLETVLHNNIIFFLPITADLVKEKQHKIRKFPYFLFFPSPTKYVIAVEIFISHIEGAMELAFLRIRTILSSNLKWSRKRKE
jgi:hypothetical protein